jgi:MscS family membrane protein
MTLQARKRKSVGATALVLMFVLSGVLVSMTVGASQPEFVQVIEIDNYEKHVVAGQSVTYNWTLLNSQSASDLTVNVSGRLSGSGWSLVIDRPSVLLPAGSLNMTFVTVTAPTDSGDLSSVLNLTISAYMDGFLVQVTDMSAVSSIRGALASSDRILGIWSNPLPSPLDNEWGVFLLNVLIWLGIAIAVAFGMDRILKVITRKTKTALDDIILGIIRTPILLIIFAFGAVQSLDALHKYIPEDARESVWSLYQVILVLVIFYLAYKLFKEILLHYGKLIAERTESKIDDVLMPVLEKIGVVVIGLVAVGYVLTVLHVDLTMFVAGGVVVSMVLAFAAQETLSNFFSGIFILLDRPFAEGDTVILSDGDWCEIRHIGLRTTRLYRFSDATIVTLPNNRLINDKITRVTNVQDPAKVNVTVGVAYGSDPAKAREAISKAIKAMPYSLLTDKTKEPLILLDQMADSSLLFKVIVWLNDSDKRVAAADRLTEEIYLRLKEAGIEIPITQRLVHVKKADD